jgi:hypothetical protein
MVELSQNAAKACFDSSLLGGREFGGNNELGEIQERVTDAFETLLELGRERGGGGARLRLVAHPAERCFEKLVSVGVVGHAVSGDEHESLSVFEAVLLDGTEDGILVLVGQGAQGVRQGGAHRAVSELGLGRFGQAGGEVHAACHPLRLAPKLSSDGLLAEGLFGQQGEDDPRLVERGESSWGRIGQQHQALVFFGWARALQDDRDEGVSLLAPVHETFEAVEDLVLAVVGGHDAQGQLRGIVGKWVERSGSQTGVAGLETVNGEKADVTCRLTCGRRRYGFGGSLGHEWVSWQRRGRVR